MEDMQHARETGFPRILVINSVSMNTDEAESITIRGIWAAWPKDRILEIHFGDEKTLTNQSGIRSIVVPTRYAPFVALSGLRVFRRLNRRMKKAIPDSGSADAQKKQNASVVNSLRQWFALSVSNSVQFMPRAIMRNVAAFQPEVIYTAAGNLKIIRHSVRLSKLLNIPIVPHFMDNWQEALEWNTNPLLKSYKKKIDQSLKKLYGRVNCALAISDRMAQVYERKYGIRHLALMNTIDIDAYRCRAKRLNDEVRFVYAGGLHLERWKALNEIGHAIDRSEHLTPTFSIHCSDKDRLQYGHLFTAKCIRLLGFVDHAHIRDVYEEADILVHAETERLKDDLYAKYSLTTKLPEYLASNRIFLYYGPTGIYLTEYLSSNDLCFVATDENKLPEIILSATRNETEGARKVQNALLIASRDYTARKAMQVLCDAMCAK